MPGQKPGSIPGCTRIVIMPLIAIIALIVAAGLILAIYLEKDDE
jgi:hypothetical protein